MTDQSLQRFESPDPAVRRQAILEAGRAGDRRALPCLAKIYKTDPDPVMRELALKAGKRIKTLMDSATSPAADSAAPTVPPAPVVPVGPPAPTPALVSYDDYTYTPAPTVPATSTGTFTTAVSPTGPTVPVGPITPIAPIAPITPIAPIPPRKAVSARTREMAKSRVDTAVTYKLQNETESALASLAEALRLNPALETDALVINLATTLTGLPAAAEALEAVKRMPTSVKPARLKAEGASAESPLVNTVLEVAIYFALTVVLWLIIILVISRQSDASFQEMTGGQSRFASNPLRGIGFMFMMLVIFISAGMSTLVTLFSNTLYYAVGIPLGGVGDWNRVISAMLRVQIVSSIIGGVLLGITLLLVPVPSMTGTHAQIEAAATQWAHGMELMGILYGITGIGSLGAMAYMIGKAHDFGFVKGLATIIAGTVVQCCGCVLLSMAAAPSLSSRPPGY